MGNLEARLEKLEQRRQQEAGEEIKRRARSASADSLARFLLARELAPEGERIEAMEERVWGYLDTPLEMAQTASRQAGWAEELGDMLAARPGLLAHMYSTYPELTRKRFGAEKRMLAER